MPIRHSPSLVSYSLSNAAFALTIFTSAFLLFEVEPMMGKFLLPWFGGAPSVWTTCILFFQLLLLGGYVYAHLAGTYLLAAVQARVHLTLAVLCLIIMTLLALAWGAPIMPPESWKPRDPAYPSLRILVTLCATVGLPYLVLSATAPLLQVWFASTGSTSSPYRLYALSNLGSMLGLLSYPFLIEPVFSLHRQAELWYSVFALFLIGLAASALSLKHLGGKSQTLATGVEHESEPGASANVQLLWLALTGCASLLFLAVTNQLCEEVAAVPLLWVLPLSIYLLSFIICFGSEGWYRRAIFNPALAVAIVLTCAVLYRSYTYLLLQIGIYSFLVASGCMVCHGELARLKPHRRQLTRFYLMVSGGGAAGGLIGALVAPRVFRGYWELQFSIWGCAALLVVCLMHDRDSWIHRRRPVLAFVLWAGAVMLPELMFAGTGKLASGLYYDAAAVFALLLGAVTIFRRRQPAHSDGIGFVALSAIALLIVLASVLLSTVNANLAGNLLSIRNFYGAFAVIEQNADDPQWHSYVLRHGRTIHGIQYPEPGKRGQPTAYFGASSGIGLLMRHHPKRLAADPGHRSLRVGIIGLGIGTIAAYGEPGDYIRFYEINPAIIQVASSADGYFSYLRDSRARVDTLAGDARLAMEREVQSGQSQHFDILVLDAFSGDAIPIHLLTREAMAVYLQEITADGTLALHISNNYLDLRPVAARLARHFGMRGGWIHSVPANRITMASDWIVLTRNPAVLAQPAISRNLMTLELNRAVPLWTDDFSNLFEILRRPD